jgi:hypothetical protein
MKEREGHEEGRCFFKGPVEETWEVPKLKRAWPPFPPEKGGKAGGTAGLVS